MEQYLYTSNIQSFKHQSSSCSIVLQCWRWIWIMTLLSGTAIETLMQSLAALNRVCLQLQYDEHSNLATQPCSSDHWRINCALLQIMLPTTILMLWSGINMINQARLKAGSNKSFLTLNNFQNIHNSESRLRLLRI